jgi:hypothetical protein
MISNDYTTTSPYGLVVFQDFGFHPFGGIISDYQNILIFNISSCKFDGTNEI